MISVVELVAAFVVVLQILSNVSPMEGTSTSKVGKSLPENEQK